MGNLSWNSSSPCINEFIKVIHSVNQFSSVDSTSVQRIKEIMLEIKQRPVPLTVRELFIRYLQKDRILETSILRLFKAILQQRREEIDARPTQESQFENFELNFFASLFGARINVILINKDEGELVVSSRSFPTVSLFWQATDYKPFQCQFVISLFKIQNCYCCAYEKDYLTNFPFILSFDDQMKQYYELVLLQYFSNPSKKVVDLEEQITEAQSDICHNCQRSLYRCFTDTIYPLGPTLCPFCNEHVNCQQYNLFSTIEICKEAENRARKSTLSESLKETCIHCHKNIVHVFDRIKLPNCEHSLHKECFEGYWVQAILCKYTQETANGFEENLLHFSCTACDSEVSLKFITCIVPWRRIVEGICDVLYKEYEQQAEQLARQLNERSMCCCKKKFRTLDLRQLLYNSLKAQGSYDIRCKACGKDNGFPLKKVTTPIEYKVLTRFICAGCKTVAPFFATLTCGHYLCRSCFCDAKGPKVNCSFCGRCSIKKFWTSCCSKEIEYEEYRKYLYIEMKKSQSTIQCKYCSDSLRLFDLPKEYWTKDSLWNMNCANCNFQNADRVSLSCGHTLCNTCLFTRCVSTCGNEYSCPTCWKVSRGNLCNCPKLLTSLPPDKPEFYCKNSSCGKLLPPSKMQFFAKGTYENARCTYCRKEVAFTCVYTCSHHTACLKCLKASVITMGDLYFNGVPAQCGICAKGFSHEFLYGVAQFCIAGEKILEKYVNRHYPKAIVNKVLSSGNRAIKKTTSS